ncbi:unnamed protein product, partial [marine sediment metagenome]
ACGVHHPAARPTTTDTTHTGADAMSPILHFRFKDILIRILMFVLNLILDEFEPDNPGSDQPPETPPSTG